MVSVVVVGLVHMKWRVLINPLRNVYPPLEYVHL